MRKLWSVSARIMIAISLVAAASCAGLAAFGLWRQNTAVELALHRELQSDYANMIGAMDSDTRAVQAVANAVANMPELKPLIRAQDRAGIIALLDKTSRTSPLGIELITIQIPPRCRPGPCPQPEGFRRQRDCTAQDDRPVVRNEEADRRRRSWPRRSQHLRRDPCDGRRDVAGDCRRRCSFR